MEIDKGPRLTTLIPESQVRTLFADRKPDLFVWRTDLRPRIAYTKATDEGRNQTVVPYPHGDYIHFQQSNR